MTYSLKTEFASLAARTEPRPERFGQPIVIPFRHPVSARARAIANRRMPAWPEALLIVASTATLIACLNYYLLVRQAAFLDGQMSYVAVSRTSSSPDWHP